MLKKLIDYQSQISTLRKKNQYAFEPVPKKEIITKIGQKNKVVDLLTKHVDIKKKIAEKERELNQLKFELENSKKLVRMVENGNVSYQTTTDNSLHLQKGAKGMVKFGRWEVDKDDLHLVFKLNENDKGYLMFKVIVSTKGIDIITCSNVLINIIG